jgi:hypothetical protein
MCIGISLKQIRLQPLSAKPATEGSRVDNQDTILIYIFC